MLNRIFNSKHAKTVWSRDKPYMRGRGARNPTLRQGAPNRESSGNSALNPNNCVEVKKA